ncbi:MAG: TetR/AcrR family transcriptional regulator [Flavobacteriaceae bacterium]
MSRWANAVPDRDEQLEIKRKAIIREAAKVFNRRGMHGTTLDEVAERLGVTKTALYRYVRNKDELLFACHQEAMEIARECVDQGEAAGRTGLEKIQIGMGGYLREMIGAMGVPVLILEENALSEERAAEIIAMRDDFEIRMRRLVEEGIRDGSILPLNPKLAIFILLGAVHWVTKWYSPSGPWSADDVAEALIELATRGLAAKPDEILSSAIHRVDLPLSKGS